MSKTPLHRISVASARPAARACVVAAAGLASVLLLTGCAGAPTAPEDAPNTAARSLLKKISFATEAVPPADFVKAQRRPPGSLAYIPISAPQDEPKLKPADKATIDKRIAAASALKPGRDAIAARRPQMQAPPQLPASALEAKREHDERMRERATEAE